MASPMRRSARPASRNASAMRIQRPRTPREAIRRLKGAASIVLNGQAHTPPEISSLSSLALPTGIIDKFVAWHQDHWEPVEWLVHQTYKDVLRPGDIAVDGGVLNGLHTEGMARCVYPGGLVHSIEPN